MLQPAALTARAAEGGLKHRAASEPSASETEAEDEAAVATPPTIEDGPPPSIDDAAESAFLADARERGEVVTRKSAAEAEEETTAKKPLPPLDQLINQIPGDVREVLEDLFRARFVSVKRFPKKALKSDK